MTALTLRRDILGRNLKFNNFELNPLAAYTALVPKQYDCIVERYGFDDNGGATAEEAKRSTWVLTGYAGANTALVDASGVAKQRVYFKENGTGNTYDSQGYLTAAMDGDTVMECTPIERATGGTVTLGATNGSGLSGTYVVAANAVNDTWYVDIEVYHTIYDADVDSASENIIGFLTYNDEDTSANNWEYAEAGEIVNFNTLLATAGIANCVGLFKLNTLRRNLRVIGWLV